MRHNKQFLSIIKSFAQAINHDDVRSFKKLSDIYPGVLHYLYNQFYQYLFDPQYINKTLNILNWLLKTDSFINFLIASNSLLIIISHISYWLSDGELNPNASKLLNKKILSLSY